VADQLKGPLSNASSRHGRENRGNNCMEASSTRSSLDTVDGLPIPGPSWLPAWLAPAAAPAWLAPAAAPAADPAAEPADTHPEPSVVAAALVAAAAPFSPSLDPISEEVERDVAPAPRAALDSRESCESLSSSGSRPSCSVSSGKCRPADKYRPVDKYKLPQALFGSPEDHAPVFSRERMLSLSRSKSPAERLPAAQRTSPERLSDAGSSYVGDGARRCSCSSSLATSQGHASARSRAPQMPLDKEGHRSEPHVDEILRQRGSFSAARDFDMKISPTRCQMTSRGPVAVSAEESSFGQNRLSVVPLLVI